VWLRRREIRTAPTPTAKARKATAAVGPVVPPVAGIWKSTVVSGKVVGDPPTGKVVGDPPTGKVVGDPPTGKVVGDPPIGAVVGVVVAGGAVVGVVVAGGAVVGGTVSVVGTQLGATNVSLISVTAPLRAMARP